MDTRESLESLNTAIVALEACGPLTNEQRQQLAKYARRLALLVERTNGHADALRRLGVRLLAAADAMEQK